MEIVYVTNSKGTVNKVDKEEAFRLLSTNQGFRFSEPFEIEKFIKIGGNQDFKTKAGLNSDEFVAWQNGLLTVATEQKENIEEKTEEVTQAPKPKRTKKQVK